MASFAGVFGRNNKSKQTSSLFSGAPGIPVSTQPAPVDDKKPSVSAKKVAAASDAGVQKKRKSQRDADNTDSQKQKKQKKNRVKNAPVEVTNDKAAGVAKAEPSQQLQRQPVHSKRESGQPATSAQQRHAGRKTVKNQEPEQNAATADSRKMDRVDSTALAEKPLPVAAQGIEQAEDHAQDDKLDRTVFVGNLQATMKPKLIKQLFSRWAVAIPPSSGQWQLRAAKATTEQALMEDVGGKRVLMYGKIESVRLRSVPVQLDAKLPRRAAVILDKVDADRATAHAYVVFSTPEEAQAALVHNMQVVNGFHVIVNLAAGSGGTAEARSYNRSRSIFVGNLHFTVQDEDLVRFFSNGKLDPELEGAVTAVRVVRDKATRIGKGIAFVEFGTKAAAAAAMRLNEPKLGGRLLRISYLKMPKAKPQPDPSTEGAAKGKSTGRGAQERLMKKAAVKLKAPSWMGVRTKGPTKTSGQPSARIAPIKPTSAKAAKAGAAKPKARPAAKQHKAKPKQR